MAQHTAPARRGGASAGFGVVLIVLGAVFLLDQVFRMSLWSSFWSMAWPFGIVATGLAFFVAMAVGGKSVSALAIPGSIITTVGLILTYQDLFDRYETWSYAWALIVVSVGVGLLIKGFWTDDPAAFQGGLRVAKIGAILFVAFGAFFELVIGLSGFGLGDAGQWFWPLLLIGLGAVMLITSGTRKSPR